MEVRPLFFAAAKAYSVTKHNSDNNDKLSYNQEGNIMDLTM